MKKILSTLALVPLFLVASFAVGYGIGTLLGGGSQESVDLLKLFKAVVLCAVALVVGFLVHTVLHEAGHLLGGLLTGYRFLSFRIFNLCLQRDDSGLHWRYYDLGGTVGQCLMTPPQKTPMPYFWYNAGGVLVNLLICVLCACLLACVDLSMFGFSFCVMSLIVGAWLFFLNAIPMTVGFPNDGKTILTLYRHPEQRRIFYAMLAVVTESARGKRLSEMPSEWFVSAPLTGQSTIMDVSARNLTYSWLMDNGQFDEAREMADEFLSLGEKVVPRVFRMEVVCDRLLLELMTLRREEVIRELWSKEQQKYVQAYKTSAPMKSALLFAYELYVHRDKEAALKHLEEVKSRQNRYTQLGDVGSALELMTAMLEKVAVEKTEV